MNVLPLNRAAPIPQSNAQNQDPGVVLHTWYLDAKRVRLFRTGDVLEWELTYTIGNPKRGFVRLPQGRSVENCIEHLKTLTPVVVALDRVEFRRPEQVVAPVQPRATIESARSQLDPETVVDSNFWAVTLTDTFSSELFEPLTWGGHAAIYLEGVENGRYEGQRSG